MIEVGDTVERTGGSDSTGIKRGEIDEVKRVIGGFIVLNNHANQYMENGEYDILNFKKVKGAEMNNIEKLKKEHKERGETIKRMEEEEKPVWNESNVERGIIVNNKINETYTIVWDSLTNKYRFLSGSDCVCMTKHSKAEMVKYLNDNHFVKA